jgi:hypothetical protein
MAEAMTTVTLWGAGRERGEACLRRRSAGRVLVGAVLGATLCVCKLAYELHVCVCVCIRACVRAV